ncbi:hypothetical protein PTTG_12129 [Puccinia triticina 1-1 BBBD Race 1]|uniref:Uncharacterized protein n=1 Tax=Puccinia triticina (isolate 1-1 / race 1 (BBBD)) TaxID=630390 RepID=A0A180GUJ1_PUCT1|nr:hypothetical protein PTTG_12129 [Puccinia triticina 1-1 BBBD Race 1]
MSEQNQSTKRQPSTSTLHLFWPNDHPLDSTGYLIGWKIESVYCVATLVENWPVTSSNQPIRQLDGMHESSKARLLGQLNPEGNSSGSPSPSHGHEGWMTITYHRGTLQIKGLKDEEETILVIYERPSMRRHHFLSLRPLLKPSLVSSQFASSSKPSGNEPLAQKIKLLDQLYPHRAMPGPECGHPREMSKVIQFVNSSEEIHNRIHHYSTPKTVDRKNATPKPDGPPCSHPLPYHLDSILALSTFLQQFNVRLAEISSWPSRYRKINREEDADLSGRRAEYVMLFNTLWLIANDIIFGQTSGAILMENSEPLADWLEYHLQTYTVTLVKRALHWTNSYPVGLKLNDQLGQAFCLCSNMAVDFWHIYVLKHAYLILPRMIWIVGFVSLFGNTFTLAIASDFLTIATFHLWIIYRLFTFIFDCQLRFLSVLFNIFRGNLLFQKMVGSTAY